MTEVYKVVKVWKSYLGGKHLESAQNNSLAVCYFIGKDVFPTVGFLYAFDTYDHAERFRMWIGVDRRKVFRADADIEDRPVYVAEDTTGYGMREFWQSGASPTLGRAAPMGSVWCSRIRLLEEVSAD